MKDKRTRLNRYNPSGGGHAPGHLRDAFIEYVENGAPVIDGKPLSLRWLIGQLWNCTDVMPSFDCDELDMPLGSTYAMAARKLRDRPS